MSTLDLRTIKIRSGEQWRDTRAVDLQPVELGGQRYIAAPEHPEADLTISRTTSGLLFELAFESRLYGPCFRCLNETSVVSQIHGREYQAATPDDSGELETPYVADDQLDLSAWARDAVVLSLPDKILCRPDCAGLCPVCGRDLNEEPHAHEETVDDPRWAALAELKERL